MKKQQHFNQEGREMSCHGINTIFARILPASTFSS